ncbi:TPA: LOG family protein [Candidatus Woesearchaeota archaeon]|nr:hypothetical protein [archaeon]HIJ10510.1 LOG family protein [Candidatus Woesearchaeota archaeon]|tara:strand:+ start:250 stop:882 length:633 start_codon:yes stop_codon:yes gene_type:complete
MTRKVTIHENHFRIAIFGSARLKKGDPRYKLVYNLAKKIAEQKMDIVTGGGPGLMDAASRGHHAGRLNGSRAHSIGLTIKLPREQHDGFHLDIKKEYSKFSGRLDEFMRLSNAVIVAPGGIGTLLELLYTWQLVQVKHICETPIILLGNHWQGLLDWIKKEMANKKLMSQDDFRYIFVVNSVSETMKLLTKVKEDSKKGHVCRNFSKYKH